MRIGITSLPNMEIAGEAGDGEEAVAMALELQPDIILMDLHLPGVNGIEGTHCIVQACPHIGILVLTMLGNDDSVFGTMHAGARGYLLKGVEEQYIPEEHLLVSAGLLNSLLATLRGARGYDV